MNDTDQLGSDQYEEEEEEECRVCRGPAEEDHPLFKPCVCSGSIGLTHQDCLQSWLKVQRGDGSCELCKTKFRFAPQYSENAPDRLSAFEVIFGLSRRAVSKWLPLTLRCLFAASLWLFVAPLITAYLYYGWMARPSVILERIFSYKLLLNDLVSGDVIAACIIISFLSLMSFADFLRVEWQNRGVGRRNNNNNNNQNQNNQAAPEEADIDNGIWDHAQQQILQQHQQNITNDPKERFPGLQERIRQNPDLQEQNRRVPEERIRALDEIGRQNDNNQNNNFDDDSSSNNERISKEGNANDNENDVNRDSFGSGDNDEDDDGSMSKDDTSWNENYDEFDESEDDLDGDDDDDEEDDDEFNDMIDNAVNLAAAVRQNNRAVLGEGDLNGVNLGEDGEVAALGENPPLPVNEQQQPERPRLFQRNDPRLDQPPLDIDGEDQLDMDINIALDELLGIRGPMVNVGRNLLWLLAFNAVYLGFFAFVPRIVGAAISTVFFNSTIFADNTAMSAQISNATNNSEIVLFQFNASEVSLANIWKAVDAESMRHNTAFRLHDVSTVALGYASLAISILFFRFLWLVYVKVRSIRSGRAPAGNNGNADEVRDAFNEMNFLVNGFGGGNDFPPFDDDRHGVAISIAFGVALDAMVAIVKVGTLLFLKMFLLPILLGLALDLSTTAIFGSSLEGRITYAGKDLFSFFLLHWVAGITFMLLVTVSVLQLREVAHPGLLAQMIRPQEPQPDLLGNLMHESVGTHAKRMVLSLVIYAFLLILHVYLPIKFIFADVFKRSNLELKLAHVLTPQLQVPLELLIFHLCMLALLEKYKNCLGGVQHFWLKIMSGWMGLSDHILPHSVANFRLVGSRPVYEKNNRKVDNFWYNLAKEDKNASDLLLANIDSFDRTEANALSAGLTKPNGERVLRFGSDFIRLPVRLPGRAVRSRSILLPTKYGKYRLKRDSFNKSSPVIQLWEEIPGEPIPRPPEGWDDLGAGGADVQGRWAWGGEKMSQIEHGVAARKPFVAKGQSTWETFYVLSKLLLLGFFSWFAVTGLVFVALTIPFVVGRTMYYLLRIPDKWIHDPFAFLVGFIMVFPFVRSFSLLLTSSTLPLTERIGTWIRRFHPAPPSKSLVLVKVAILWFFLCPLFLGSIYEIGFVKSGNWFIGQEPFVDMKSTLLSISLGTVLLHLWSNLCVAGVFTRNYRVFLVEGRDANNDEENDDSDDRLEWQGEHGRIARFWNVWRRIIMDWEWDQVDELVMLDECAFPVAKQLFLTIMFPIIAFGLISWRFTTLSAFARAAVVRSVLASSCTVQICRLWQVRLKKWLEAAHHTARDDMYLIGEILLNHGE